MPFFHVEPNAQITQFLIQANLTLTLHPFFCTDTKTYGSLITGQTFQFMVLLAKVRQEGPHDGRMGKCRLGYSKCIPSIDGGIILVLYLTSIISARAYEAVPWFLTGSRYYTSSVIKVERVANHGTRRRITFRRR
jgi:hypothetical protein